MFIVHEELGRGTFLTLYLSAGVFGSLTSLTYYTIARNFNTFSNGASGAINGILSAATLLVNPLIFAWTPFRGERVTLPVIEAEVPASALILWPLLIGLELWGLRSGLGKNMDYFAHIGGYAAGTTGTLYWLWHRKDLRKAETARTERR